MSFPRFAALLVSVIRFTSYKRITLMREVKAEIKLRFSLTTKAKQYPHHFSYAEKG